MITYFLQVSIVMFLFLAMYQILLRKEHFFALNRVILWLILLVSLLLPITSFWLLPAQQTAITGIVNLQEIDVWIAQTPPGVIENVSAENPHNLFFLLYAAVAIALLSRLLYGLILLRRIRKNAEVRFINGQPVYFSSMVDTPMSFFRQIFLPLENKYNEEALSLIIKHETAHGNLYHTADNIVSGIFKSVSWCIPPVYWFDYLLKEVHEFQADYIVVNQEPDKRRVYGMLLLNAPDSFSGFSSIPSHHFFSSLKNRIIMMTTIKTNPFARFKLLLFVPTFFMAVLCLTIFQQQDAIGMANNEFNIVQDSVYKDVDVMPLFPGCFLEGSDLKEARVCSETKLLQFVYQNIRYPEAAVKAEAEGTAVVRFIVEKDGRLSDIKIVRSVFEDLDNETIRVVELMNTLDERWTPGKQNEEPVRVEFNLPVRFRLTN